MEWRGEGCHKATARCTGARGVRGSALAGVPSGLEGVNSMETNSSSVSGGARLPIQGREGLAAAHLRKDRPQPPVGRACAGIRHRLVG